MVPSLSYKEICSGWGLLWSHVHVHTELCAYPPIRTPVFPWDWGHRRRVHTSLCSYVRTSWARLHSVPGMRGVREVGSHTPWADRVLCCPWNGPCYRSTLMHNLNCVHSATSVTLGKETGLSFVCIKSFFTVLEKMYNITLGLDEMSFHSLIRSRVWFLTNAVKVIEALRKFFNSMYSWIYVEQNVLVPCLKSE